MGRLLSKDYFDKVAVLSGTCFQTALVEQPDSPPVSLRPSDPDLREIRYVAKDDLISAATFLKDLSGQPPVEIVVNEPREILNQGLHALRIALSLLAVGTAACLAMMVLMLHRSVLTPVRRISQAILDRRMTGKPSNRLDMGRCTSYEICLLAEEFKLLLESFDIKNTELGEINLTLIEEARKLKEAEARLRNLDQLKSEFISTAAHELRTPVASIMGISELLSDPAMAGPFNEAQKQEFLQEILDNSERLTRLVNEILDLSRIEAGKPIPLSMEESSFRELLVKVVKRLRFKESQQLVLNVKDDAPVMMVFDESGIGQVMENLLSNALKYSLKESTVTIEAGREGQHCKITVSDEGIGMTAEQKKRIFDKFYRADASDTAIRGLGLGMSIVKQIIVDHGGTIWVDSLLGQGTRVTFTLPIETSPTPSQAAGVSGGSPLAVPLRP